MSLWELISGVKDCEMNQRLFAVCRRKLCPTEQPFQVIWVYKPQKAAAAAVNVLVYALERWSDRQYEIIKLFII